MSSKPTIAVFGATGGSAQAALVLAIKNGHQTIAFVRTPEKLTKALTEEHKLTSSQLSDNLTIIAGDAYDHNTIKPVFAHNPSIILSGIGSLPKFQASVTTPIGAAQPGLCEKSCANILRAAREARDEGSLVVRPFFAAISTTGVSKKQRDVPFALFPLYHWMLSVVHEDKALMEEVIAAGAGEANSPLSGFAIVRPTLLMDGPGKGLDKVRCGWEKHPLAAAKKEGGSEEEGVPPAMGWQIKRADVGAWIYENLLKGSPDEWNGRCVSLAY